MSWSFQGKAEDKHFENEVQRVFAENKTYLTDYPASLRAVEAVQEFVSKAHKNIPAGSSVAFKTYGHMDTNGRGNVNVTVEIFVTPPEGE